MSSSGTDQSESGTADEVETQVKMTVSDAFYRILFGLFKQLDSLYNPRTEAGEVSKMRCSKVNEFLRKMSNKIRAEIALKELIRAMEKKLETRKLRAATVEQFKNSAGKMVAEDSDVILSKCITQLREGNLDDSLDESLRGILSQVSERSITKTSIRTWHIQSEEFYMPIARAPRDEDLEQAKSEQSEDAVRELEGKINKRNQVIVSMCRANYFLNAIDMADKFSSKAFLRSRDRFVRQVKMLNVLASLQGTFFGEIEGVLLNISQDFTQKAERGESFTFQDLQTMIEKLTRHLRPERIMEIQKTIQKIITMLGGIHEFGDMVDKLFGNQPVLRNLIRALLQGDDKSLISRINEKAGMFGLGVEEEDDNSDDEGDEDDREGVGEGRDDDGGRESEADEAGVMHSRTCATKDDIRRAYDDLSRMVGGKDFKEFTRTSMEALSGKPGSYDAFMAAAASFAAKSGAGEGMDEESIKQALEEIESVRKDAGQVAAQAKDALHSLDEDGDNETAVHD